ncbi:MAG: hypothetical protein J6U03_02125 [Muribaculaceae bacterium]|nr:hypothetical protein [Muribaculaceae bacterium]
MRKILLLSAILLTSSTAFAADKVADYFYPADTTLVHYAPNAIFNGQIDSIVTRVEKSEGTSELLKMTRRNLVGETIADKIQLTDSTVVLGICYQRSHLELNMGGRGSIIYNHELLRIPTSADSASWTAYNNVSQALYVSKFERTSKFVTLCLVMNGAERDVKALRVVSHQFTRQGEPFPYGDRVEYWAEHLGLILAYDYEGKLIEYASSLTNVPKTDPMATPAKK